MLQHIHALRELRAVGCSQHRRKRSHGPWAASTQRHHLAQLQLQATAVPARDADGTLAEVGEIFGGYFVDRDAHARTVAAKPQGSQRTASCAAYGIVNTVLP